MAASEAAEARRPLSTAALAGVLLAAAFAAAALLALGTWQLQRRAWKLELIERVQQRVHAVAQAAPEAADWPSVGAARDEYRRVRLEGSFLHDRETLVHASTALGVGYWVLTPLRRDDGSLVLVNRGFIPTGLRERGLRQAAEPRGRVALEGLLRVTEPGGYFLRRNEPASGRWHSRDVQAISAARELGRKTAPYFIDASEPLQRDAGPTSPVGGLTVVDFSNNHLVYALTWYALALMVIGAAGRVVFEEARLRRSATAAALAGEALR